MCFLLGPDLKTPLASPRCHAGPVGRAAPGDGPVCGHGRGPAASGPPEAGIPLPSREHQNNSKGKAERLALKPFTPGLRLRRAREPGSPGRRAALSRGSAALRTRASFAAETRSTCLTPRPLHLPGDKGALSPQRPPRASLPVREAHGCAAALPGEAAAPPLRARREKAAGNPGLAAVQVISCFLRGSNSD